MTELKRKPKTKPLNGPTPKLKETTWWVVKELGGHIHRGLSSWLTEEEANQACEALAMSKRPGVDYVVERIVIREP